MIQAFVVDMATGETVQRLRAASIDGLADFPLAAGQEIVPFGLDVDIETVETFADGEAIHVRPRTIDPVQKLEIAKIARRAAVLVRRDRAEWGGCTTPLGRMQTDPDSQRKLNGAALMAMIAQTAGQPYLEHWTMENNATVAHDAAAMIAAGIAVGEHVSACHARGLALKDEIDAAADLATLEAIDIDAGWP